MNESIFLKNPSFEVKFAEEKELIFLVEIDLIYLQNFFPLEVTS